MSYVDLNGTNITLLSNNEYRTISFGGSAIESVTNGSVVSGATIRLVVDPEEYGEFRAILRVIHMNDSDDEQHRMKIADCEIPYVHSDGNTVVFEHTYDFDTIYNDVVIYNIFIQKYNESTALWDVIIETSDFVLMPNGVTISSPMFDPIGAIIGAGSYVSQTIGGAISAGGKVASNVASNVGKVASNVGKTVSNIGGNIGKTVSDIGSNIGKTVSGGISNVGSAIGSINPIKLPNAGLPDFIGGVSSAIGNVGSVLGSTIGNVIDNTGKITNQISGQITGQITSGVSGLTSGLSGAISQADQIKNTVASGVGSVITSNMDTIGKTLSNSTTAFLNNYNNVQKEVSSRIGDVIQTGMLQGATVQTELNKKLTSGIDVVKSTLNVNNAKTAFGVTIQRLDNPIVKTLALTNPITAVMATPKIAVGLYDQSKKAIETVSISIDTVLKSPQVTTVLDTLGNVTNVVVAAVVDTTGNVVKALKGTVNAAGQFVNSTGAVIGKAIDSTVSFFSSIDGEAVGRFVICLAVSIAAVALVGALTGGVGIFGSLIIGTAGWSAGEMLCDMIWGRTPDTFVDENGNIIGGWDSLSDNEKKKYLDMLRDDLEPLDGDYPKINGRDPDGMITIEDVDENGVPFTSKIPVVLNDDGTFSYHISVDGNTYLVIESGANNAIQSKICNIDGSSCRSVDAFWTWVENQRATPEPDPEPVYIEPYYYDEVYEEYIPEMDYSGFYDVYDWMADASYDSYMYDLERGVINTGVYEDGEYDGEYEGDTELPLVSLSFAGDVKITTPVTERFIGDSVGFKFTVKNEENYGGLAVVNIVVFDEELNDSVVNTKTFEIKANETVTTTWMFIPVESGIYVAAFEDAVSGAATFSDVFEVTNGSTIPRDSDDLTNDSAGGNLKDELNQKYPSVSSGITIDNSTIQFALLCGLGLMMFGTFLTRPTE